MPHGKKKKGGRPNNKKQKKGAGHGKNVNRNSVVGTMAPTRSSTAGNLTLTPENALKGVAPSYQDFLKDEQSLHESYPTMYSRYKAATNRVFQYMKENSPESIHNNKITMNTLVTIADWMEENDRPVDPAFLKDLKLAIRMRSRAAKSIFGGGDAGHKHLLTVLVYIWGVSISLQRAPVKSKELDKEVQEKLSLGEAGITASRNRFEALNDEDIDDEEADEEFFPSKRVPRPEPQPEPMSLEELIRSDDRNDISLFLLSMDELMRAVSEQYAAMAKQVVAYKRQQVPDTAIIENLMEAAVGTNFAIQQMQQLELDFETQHPHISTPYRMLSTFVFPEIIENITKIAHEHGEKTCLEKDVSLFLGDCLECSFRTKSDPENKNDVVVEDFCERFKISSTGSSQIKDIFFGLHRLFITEVPISNETEMNELMIAELRKAVPHFGSHRWIPRDMKFIGGDRAIHHTLRLLQSFGTVVKNTSANAAIIARKGFFGPSPWQSGRSRKIHNDLDELLMADILPQWFLLCRNGILGMAKLPRQNEISALWVCMKNYFDNPTKPVSWSSVFAVHAMLTAILETDKVERDLTYSSKLAFNLFFEQLDRARCVKKTEADSLESQGFERNMTTVEFLRNLGLPVFGDRAIWNPLSGGTIFSYLAIFGNVEAGCCLIDDRAQLRIVLHLYHALRVNNFIRRGEIPLLDVLYDAFKSSRAIWEGPLPKKGQFVERFWVSFGSSRGHAAEMAEKSREMIQAASVSRQNPFGNYRSVRRKMRPIEPAELATSFRRICNRDFHDVVDNYHTPEQRQRNRGSDYYTFAIQMNDTLDAIEREQQLFALNLPACGVYLEQFVCSLSRIFQWDKILVSAQAQHSALGTDKRPGVAYMFAQYLLGALDFARDPSNLRFLEIPQGLASTAFISMYFNQIGISQIMWFQAVREED